MSEPTLRILSLGAGRQSSALLMMSARGDLPRLDAAIFADTGAEPDGVYRHLDRLEQDVARPAGIPVYRVSYGNLADDLLDPNRQASIPAYTLGPDGSRGMLSRKCTQRYKLSPLLAKVRELLGAEIREAPCRYCDGTGTRVAPWRAKRGEHVPGPCSVCKGTGQIRRVGPPPKGAWAEQWIGFGADEITRVSNHSDTNYARSRFPLVELGMTTQQCLTYLERYGFTSVAKSACWMCPYHGNREWRRLRDQEPEAWKKAVAFDRAYRRGPGMIADRFLHASLLPLDQAPIDHFQPRRDVQQLDLMDELFARRLEEGDPDGCSPWGCRSGERVA